MKKPDGSKATRDSEKADTLNDFFKTVYLDEGTGNIPEPPNYAYQQTLNNFKIDEEDVKKLLKNLEPFKAPGPDSLHPYLIKQLADQLAEPVTIIYKLSLKEGVIPSDWKTATVCPIYKRKGNRNDPSNYRPVSLTCILCKVMETLVRKQIMIHLQINNLLSQQQHGFVTGKSCMTNLIETIDDWTQALEEDSSLDAIYMDFKKAFDTVPHQRLLRKIQATGIQGQTLKWIEAFLENRTQKVVVNGAKSSPAEVTSGIPQGSVLGPTLFVIYINDLPQNLNNKVQLFADDTKLYGKSNTSQEQDLIQQDLNTLQEWSEKWLLAFHPDKCHTIKIGKTKSYAKYHMKHKEGEVVELKEATSEKDLGVVVDNDLNFKQHIATAVSKGNKVLGLIRRSFKTGEKETFVNLYKSIVRPLLEYGNVVWHPLLKSQEKDIEDVQRRATKLIGSIKDLTYSERLEQLKLPSLQHRRRRGDMIETYKYITKKYSAKKPEWKLNDRNRGNGYKLAKHGPTQKQRVNFLTNRVINDWNKLPAKVVQAETLNQFKNRLDNHWKKEDLYNPTCQ